MVKISAVIFDLNGTILDDEEEYGAAFSTVLKRFGIIPKTKTPQVRGIGVKENWPILIQKYGIKTSETPESLAKATQDEYLKNINEVSLRSGFNDLAQNLKDSGYKIALATSNNWDVTDKILEKVGLSGIFDAVTTVEEVAFSKPDPELFTLTADKLGVNREECLVFEDSASGIQAAKEAGMKVIAIIGDGEESNDFSDANLEIENFLEITPGIIENL